MLSVVIASGGLILGTLIALALGLTRSGALVIVFVAMGVATLVGVHVVSTAASGLSTWFKRSASRLTTLRRF